MGKPTSEELEVVEAFRAFEEEIFIFELAPFIMQFRDVLTLVQGLID